MATKFWQVTLKGSRSAEEIQSAVGSMGALLVRVHFENGETRVYFAADKVVHADVQRTLQGASKPKTVTANEIARIG